jgi:hypothetical protein
MQLKVALTVKMAKSGNRLYNKLEFDEIFQNYRRITNALCANILQQIAINKLPMAFCA